MHREGEEVHVSTNEARAGRKGSFVLQVLVFSMAIVLIAFAAIWMSGAATSANNGGPVGEVSAT